MLHAQLAALAFAATTLAASGCGGSSKTGSTGASTGAAATSTIAASTATPATTNASPGKPMTRAESILIAKAGAICKRIDARHASVRLPTQQAIARELPLFASYQRAALAELRKLTPPASMAHDWKQFVAAAHTLASDTTRVGEYAKANHFATAGTIIPRIDKDERHISALAKHDAITGCEQVY
jgi:hypothetical protein